MGRLALDRVFDQYVEQLLRRVRRWAEVKKR
jgi:hypothetical protein